MVLDTRLEGSISRASQPERPLARRSWSGFLAGRLRLTPLNRRRWRNFKANRRGYWSLWIFLGLFVLTLFAEVIANDKPIVAMYRGELLFPVFVDYPELKFGGFLAVTDYKDKVILDEIEQNGVGHLAADWVLVQLDQQRLSTS